MYETVFDRENLARKKPLFQGLYWAHSDPIGSEHQLSMVTLERLELSRASHRILSPACLPIPPQRQCESSSCPLLASISLSVSSDSI